MTDIVSAKLKISEEDKKKISDRNGKKKDRYKDEKFFVTKVESYYVLSLEKKEGSFQLAKAFEPYIDENGDIKLRLNFDAHNEKYKDNLKMLVECYLENGSIEMEEFIELNKLIENYVHHYTQETRNAILTKELQRAQKVINELLKNNQVQEQKIKQLEVDKAVLSTANLELIKSLNAYQAAEKRSREQLEAYEKKFKSLEEQIKFLEGNPHQETKETKSTSHPETIQVENSVATSESIPGALPSHQSSANESSSFSSEEKGNRGKKIAIGLASSLSFLSLGTSITLGVLAFTTTVLAPLAPALVIGLIAGFFVLSGISLFTGLVLAHSNKSTPQNSRVDIDESASPLLDKFQSNVKVSNLGSLKRSQSELNLRRSFSYFAPDVSIAPTGPFSEVNKSQENDSTSVVSPSLSK